VRILSPIAPPHDAVAQVMEEALRSLGFKTEIALLDSGPIQVAARAGDFEIMNPNPPLQVDDPSEQATYMKSNGGYNYAKWSNPDIDRMFDEQDKILDVTKRAQALKDLQNYLLNERVNIPMGWYVHNLGYSKVVKNYPPKLPFLFDSRFRWEQVWLER